MILLAFLLVGCQTTLNTTVVELDPAVDDRYLCNTSMTSAAYRLAFGGWPLNYISNDIIQTGFRPVTALDVQSEQYKTNRISIVEYVAITVIRYDNSTIVFRVDTQTDLRQGGIPNARMFYQDRPELTDQYLSAFRHTICGGP